MRHRQRGAGLRACGRGPQAAFTLLEMLTVIIIVGLLLSIGTPSVLRMQVIAMRRASIAAVEVIDGGCKLYWNDCEQYPPSNPEGKQRVYEYLARARRLVDHGRPYGPYNGCENVKSDGSVFYDSFDYPILYYRWEQRYQGGSSQYWDGDNSDAPPNINKYVKTDGTGNIPRRDFILCSRGPDGKWPNEVVANYGGNERRAYAERDDITNFLQE